MAEKGEEDEMSGDKIKEGERVGGTRTQYIFLSEQPTTKKFCLSSSGLKRTQ